MKTFWENSEWMSIQGQASTGSPSYFWRFYSQKSRVEVCQWQDTYQLPANPLEATWETSCVGKEGDTTILVEGCRDSYTQGKGFVSGLHKFSALAGYLQKKQADRHINPESRLLCLCRPCQCLLASDPGQEEGVNRPSCGFPGPHNHLLKAGLAWSSWISNQPPNLVVNQ